MFIKENRVKSKEQRTVGSEVYFYILCSLFFSLSSSAQCAMCRAALSGEENTAKAQAVNDGIVYLMVVPYLLVAGIGYYICWMWNKKK
jgi:bacteriorhodopsin